MSPIAEQRVKPLVRASFKRRFVPRRGALIFGIWIRGWQNLTWWWRQGAILRKKIFDLTVILIWLSLVIFPWQIWFSGKVRLSDALQGTSFKHPLGTDSLGRDMLVRLSMALRQGVLPLWLAVGLGVLCGGLLALVCLSMSERGLKGPLIKGLDGIGVTLAAIPAGVMAFALAAVKERVDLTSVMWTLGLLFAARMYLLLRDLERRDQKLGYWTAHQSLGGHSLSRLWCYGINGGWRSDLAESFSLNLRVALAIEAAVSYLGFGVAEPAASFGNMLAAHFDSYLKGHVGVIIPILFALGLTAAFPGAFFRTLGRTLFAMRGHRR